MDDGRIGIAIATRDRRDALLGTLERLLALPERPPVVVVDNGSSDGTPAAVRAAFGAAVAAHEAGRNLGAAARSLAVRELGTPYVAFNDDDSWWVPGSLGRAVELLDAHPRVGLLAARVLVGDDGRLDPTCDAMRRSPLRDDDLPGPAVLGFVACGAVVRRDAYLAAGGFDARYGVGGEERRLALDLAAAGWRLVYADELVVCHHPGTGGGVRPGRLRRQVRNDLWTTWLRRSLPGAAGETARLLTTAVRRAPGAAVGGTAEALAGARWVLRERRVVPAAVEAALRSVESSG